MPIGSRGHPENAIKEYDLVFCMDPGLDILHILQDFRLSLPSSVESFFLFLSSPAFYIVLPIVLGAMLFWFSEKQKGEIILLNFIAAMAVSRAVKVTVKQPRPWVLDPTIQPSEAAKSTATSYSLPSGHASIAVSTYGSFAMLVNSRLFKVFAIMMAVLIPFGRLFLNVHTPLDIAIGVIIAVAVSVFNLKAVPWSYRDERNRQIFLAGYLVFFVIVGAYLAIVSDNPSSFNFMWMAVGLVAGLFIEGKYVHYEVRKRPFKQNLVIGMAGLVLLGVMVGVPYLLLGLDMAIAIGGLLSMISVTALYPYLIKRYDESHCID